MPAYTYESVLKDLKAEKYAPVYFLQGEEPYFIDVITNYIEKNALKDDEKSFNQTVVYGKDTNLVNILGTARRFPVMAPRQVVLVKEAQEIPDWGQEKAKTMLANYCQKPVPSTILVFAHKYKKLDGRSKLTQVLQKEAIFLETKKFYDNQIPNFVRTYLAEKQVKATEKAITLICEHIGNDLSRVTNEIDKVLLNFDSKTTTINEDIITKYVGISKEFNTFELQDALGKKDVLKANQIVHYFALNPKNNPLIPTIALLYSYFTKLIQVHLCQDKSKASIAKSLGVNPFFADDYISASQNYPLNKLIQIVHYIREADLRSKGIESNMDENQILKELIFKVLHI